MKILLVAVAAIALLVKEQVLVEAFMMGTHNNPAFPSNIETHKTITKCALDRAAYAFLRKANPQIGEPANCSTDGIWSDLVRATNSLSIGIGDYKKVRDWIWQSCADVDAKFDAASRYHFDGEKIVDANDMVIANTRMSRDLLSAGQFIESRRLVGEMLHTVQDFYSHTNWVEMGRTEPHVSLGLSRDVGPIAAANQDTCTDCIPDADNYCRQNIISSINGQGILTSGYYSGQDSVKPLQSKKCSHGGYLDTNSNTSPRGGINKDAINMKGGVVLSPHGYLHFEAAELAISASLKYLTDFWELIGDTNFGKFLAFDQRTSTIVIALDTTGSMAAEIGACIEAAKQLALTFSSAASQPSYVLSPFNDPTVGPAVLYDNVTHFVAAVTALIPYDGGDEPELCLNGILLGANAVQQPGGMMYVFTDAHAKDYEIENQVISLLREKQLIVNFVITKSINMDLYKRIASASGGQVLYVPDRSQIVSLTLSLFNATFVNLVADPTAELVEILRVESKDPVSTTPVYKVASDDSVRRMTLVMVTDRNVAPDLQITKSSAARRARSAGAEEPVDFTVVVRDSNKVVVDIADPPSGTLNVKGVFKAASEYSIAASGAASFTVVMRFMRDTPIGLAPVLSGEPLIGEPIWIFAEVNDPNYRIDSYKLLDQASQPIMEAAAQPLASDPQSFVGQFVLPSAQFRVLVEGRNTATGEEFARLMPSQFQATAALLELVDLQSSYGFNLGETNVIALKLTNVGSNRTYTFSVATTAGFTYSILPNASVMLSENMTAYVNLSVAVPSDPNLIGTVDTITVVVKAFGFDDSNSVIVSAVVRDPNADVDPPTMTTVSFTPCHGNLPCDLTSWSVVVDAYDAQTGLHSFEVRDSQSNNLTALGAVINYTPAFVVGTNETVTASLSVHCCLRSANFVARDREGNTNILTFNAWPAISSGSVAHSHSLAFFVGLSYLVELVRRFV